MPPKERVTELNEDQYQVYKESEMFSDDDVVKYYDKFFRSGATFDGREITEESRENLEASFAHRF